MSFKTRVTPKKMNGKFYIPQSVIIAPAPGVFGGWYGPHSTWLGAVGHLKAELAVSHNAGDSYEYDGKTFNSPTDLLAALKEPTMNEII